MSERPPVRLTIGIPTWNRSSLLQETLESLANQAVPANVTWEVLVCDNNSSDNTRDVVQAFAPRLPVRYLFEGRQGIALAKARLVSEASGEWLLFLDDDVLVEPGWLGAYVEGIRRYPNAAIMGGQILPRLRQPVRGLRKLLHREYPWVYGILQFQHDDVISPAKARHVFGANMGVRHDLVHLPEDLDGRRGLIGELRVGGEDMHLVSAILGRGGEGWRLAGVVVRHHIPPERSGLRRFVDMTLGGARYVALKRGMAITGSTRFRLFAAHWLGCEIARAVARLSRAWLRDHAPQGRASGHVRR